MSIFPYLCPPVCAGCGVRLSPNTQVPLCEACMEKWQAEKDTVCPRCNKRLRACGCSDRHPALSYPIPVYAVVAYREGTVGKRVILTAKRRADGHLFAFLGGELAKRILQSEERLRRNTIITYVPRSPLHVRAEGQDQSRRLAKALGAVLGLPVCACFGYRSDGYAQKELQGLARYRHAAKVIRSRKEILRVRGKQVILVDDVCTSGATLSTCYAKLRQAGVGRVICAVVAKVTGKRKSPTAKTPWGYGDRGY